MLESDSEPTTLRHYFSNLHLDISVEYLEWRSLDFNIHKYCQQVVSRTVYYVIGNRNINNFIEVSLLLSDSQVMRNLNKEYRNKDKPTNVLSFPFLKNTKDNIISIIKSQDITFLGDIAISYENVIEESLEQEKKFMEYFAYLLIHGTLHLFQYDHMLDKEAKIMEGMELKIMKSLGYYSINY